MDRTRGLACLLGAGLLLATGLGVRSADESAGPVPPPYAALPRSARTRLTGVWGIPGPVGSLNAVALAPDGRLVVSAGDDLAVRLWDVARGREIDTLDLTPAADCARCLTFAPDGRSFFAGTAGGVVLHFEVLPGASADPP